MLLLKRHLVALVRQGKKRQTIRFWTRPMLRPGQITYTPGLGKLKITAVDVLASLADLTEADARADGFPTRAALLAEIHRIYGPPATLAASPRTLYRIQFTWPLDPKGTPDGNPGLTVVPPDKRGISPKRRRVKRTPDGNPRLAVIKPSKRRAPRKSHRIQKPTPPTQKSHRHALHQYILAHAPK